MDIHSERDKAVLRDNPTSLFRVPGSERAETFLKDCVLIDLEVAGQNNIYHIGAVFGDREFQRKGKFSVHSALKELDRFCKGAKFVLGHNILHHDLPIIESVNIELEFLSLPVIDTLYLSPLAFPENPYHRLIKDYKLVPDSLNDPVSDARLAGSVFLDQWESFSQTLKKEPEVLSFYRFCFNRSKLGIKAQDVIGLAEVFAHIGSENYESAKRAAKIFYQKTENLVCPNQLELVLANDLAGIRERPVLAYCLAWLRVAGGNSVIPPWVRHRFKEVVPILKQLRDESCQDDTCRYCAVNHNPKAQLKKFFRFDDFRNMPDGTPLQREIAAEGMRDRPLLGILPTGFGKSICFQLPAFVRFHRRGLLTVVFSPLQSLMKDQVDNLKNELNTNAVEAINGMLTSPERGAVLEQVRLGDIGILYISPEQLRNRSIRETLQSREIGCWVFDEAHCISKWGHDFRSDYLYASRFIREFSKRRKSEIPSVACYTATAQKDVIGEIFSHFKDNIDQELTVFQGGIERSNLHFEVQTIGSHEKDARVHALLEERIGQPATGSAIIYCAKRKKTEDLRDYLTRQGWHVAAFHAGLKAPEKRSAQEAFLKGQVPVICATNAFGMGIDKGDVRLVIHADIPGSLENYLQEAGRAGRDTQDADCVLLYDEADIETQFKLGAMSKLHRRDIVQILRGLRLAKRGEDQEIIITTGELLRKEEVDTSFESDDYSADTKVKTAVSWLERAGYLERNENRTSVFQGKPKYNTLDEVLPKLDKLHLSAKRRAIWSTILTYLMQCDPDEGISADQIAESLGRIKGLTPGSVPDTKKIIHILHQMAREGLVQSGILMSAYLRPKGKNNARRTLDKVCRIDKAMIGILMEEHPVETVGEWVSLDMRKLNQRLLDAGYSDANTQTVRTLLTSLSRDGKGFAERQGSIDLRHSYQDRYRVKIQRSWEDILETADRRRNLAHVLLNAVYEKVPAAQNAQAEVLIEFSSDDMIDAIRRDLTIRVEENKMLAAVDRGLLFLHEQHAIILQKGLAVFRQALTIRLLPEARKRRYGKGDYEPLAQHYQQRIFQVHVMCEYARVGMEKIRQALALVAAYFTLDRKGFIKRFFPNDAGQIERATSAESYHGIVESLKNPIQEAIVCSPPDKNSLILAGPGSGKTRVVIHRCAYLMRVKRVPTQSILVLCFNHSAALTVRKRLWDLIGKDTKDVTILTYHALAMRLTGRSFSETQGPHAHDSAQMTQQFDDIIRDAIALLNGQKEIQGIEPDDIRDRLLGGYQYILVDEYQDIDQDQYQLISALAGRVLDDPDRKMSMLAVGDDDQSIYGFRNANVKFIRQFQKDYNADIFHLVENYRSTRHIIDASNALIQHNRVRMKTEHPIRIDRFRKNNSTGGRLETIDPIGKGQVQFFSVKNVMEQAAAVVTEIQRLKKIDTLLKDEDIAVFSRNGLNYQELSSVRAALDANKISYSYALGRAASFSPVRIREVTRFLTALSLIKNEIKKATDLIDDYNIHAGDQPNYWDLMLLDLLDTWKEETGNAALFVQSAIDFVYEAMFEQRREQRFGSGVYLSTVHSAKGLEFPYVFILDGGWRSSQHEREAEEERRLYYVAMTRAKESLTLFEREDCQNPQLQTLDPEHMFSRRVAITAGESLDYAGRRTDILGMKHVFMDYAGRFPAEAKIHCSLKQQTCGDQLKLVESNGSLMMAAADGVNIARLSNYACDEWRGKIEKIEKLEILGLVQRRAEDVQPEFRDKIRCDRWEIPIVEISHRLS